ncbi:uncharacterized protein TRUGW13939_08178 [Talaromyces rugulosus]|uniref:NADH-ubiquinone oxidoreductase B12 subunit n=1 Tax=Talaromyces rugulosus TaxID=121627 RepID=A0A7H8R3W8_TALRU|nr:uncharacterized protein TRUGW13939_08178 [Talaromyces rugulosus]QKX61032.1 hypothetical protein TRUGW13939_08178 [Talaromyces rugulosus]
MPSRNPTGFDINEFKAAANPRSVWAKKDPWARHEAWRFTGPFSRWNRFKGLFPGLGTATVLFAGYCVYEHYFIPADHVSHSHGHAGHSHGESHH